MDRHALTKLQIKMCDLRRIDSSPRTMHPLGASWDYNSAKGAVLLHLPGSSQRIPVLTIVAPCIRRFWCSCRCARAWARFSFRCKRDSLDWLPAIRSAMKDALVCNFDEESALRSRRSPCFCKRHARRGTA